MRQEHAVGRATGEGQRGDEPVDGPKYAVGACAVCFAHALIEVVGDHPPVLGNLGALELGEFVIALEKVDLIGEVALPSDRVEQQLVRPIHRTEGFNFLVDDLVEDDVPGTGVGQVAEPAELLEVPAMAVEIPGHHQLTIIGEAKERSLPQRILPVELGGGGECLSGLDHVGHSKPPAIEGSRSIS